MTGAYLKKAPSESSRAGVELTVQEGRDSEIFGFSATAPNIGGADWLLHLGPTNVSYLAPVGNRPDGSGRHLREPHRVRRAVREGQRDLHPAVDG